MDIYIVAAVAAVVAAGAAVGNWQARSFGRELVRVTRVDEL